MLTPEEMTALKEFRAVVAGVIVCRELQDGLLLLGLGSKPIADAACRGSAAKWLPGLVFSVSASEQKAELRMKSIACSAIKTRKK